MASTSIGFAVNLLQKNQMLNSPLGQLISGAAMLDDIESLILLGLLSSINGDKNFYQTLISIIIPIINSFIIILIGILLCISLPDLCDMILEIEHFLRYQYKRKFQKIENETDIEILQSIEITSKLPDIILLFLTIFIPSFLILLAILCKTTFLLGAFVGGVAISNINGVKSSYLRYECIISFFMSLFFVSIGFYVPVKLLFRWDIFYKGILFTIPTIITKLLVGLYEKESNKRFALGWAMVGRGEVGLMMAATALQANVLSQSIFLIVIWALLLSTAFAPFPFRFFLQKIE